MKFEALSILHLPTSLSFISHSSSVFRHRGFRTRILVNTSARSCKPLLLDRMLLAVLALVVLHLFPSSAILTIAKTIAVLWPLLHPMLIGSRRNVQLRLRANESPPLLIAGELQVKNTDRGTLARVFDGSEMCLRSKPLVTSSNANEHAGSPACAVVIGGRIIDIAVRNSHLALYSCVRRRAFDNICSALLAECN
ncbi:hypothetical protein BWQ96_09167 [Gracilariopsis chorda]|uniref:Uncharacterized protein n=1 Tax=Gracilariopsis chorda TaxID=448386 RepID=A0A2V3IGB0_9FLOR|nr:hypothetical protein BWQ96_09167 [Gracilariopsis chorda]|eukprot:PXF41135.1 hypothetical protein BWQ96_09167 [Gracilariopsis chorda]